MDSEKNLVEKILKGDQKAINFFYKKYRASLFTFVSKKTRNRQDAEDIVQEALVSALNSLPNFKFKSSLFSWLCAIANHETADFYRREKIKTILFSKAPILEEIADQALGPEGKHLKKELKEEIKNVFKQLSEGYSQILRLKYIERLSMKAIARKLKTTVKAVESKLTRARKKFKKLWRETIN